MEKELELEVKKYMTSGRFESPDGHGMNEVKRGFIDGAKWQAERMYSEEEVEQMINSFEKLCYKYQSNKDWFPSKKSEWFKQFKKEIG